MIQRESYMRRIRPFIGTDLIKVLTGIRRSGKSVMLDLIKGELRSTGVADNQILSYNFENMRLLPLCSAESLHREIIDRAAGISGKVYLFFDEIQAVAHWEKCIKSFFADKNYDIYIAGSLTNLPTDELSFHFAGRYVNFVIYPFSFAEFIELYNSTSPNTPLPTIFSKYLTYCFNDTVNQYNAQGINQMLDNLIHLELLRRGYTVTVGKSAEKEIDFIAAKKDQLLYVQVCCLLASAETIQREFGVYDCVRDNFPKYVVSMDELDFSRNGIKHRNIRDFLMMHEWY